MKASSNLALSSLVLLSLTALTSSLDPSKCRALAIEGNNIVTLKLVALIINRWW